MQKKVIRGFRLSPQQKHLWLLQQGEATLPYRAQCAIQIEGNFNRKIFETTLENVLNRHEILRTTFRCLPGMDIPLQIISDPLLVGTVGNDRDRIFPSIHEHNFRGLTPQAQEVKIQALFQEVSQLPGDFEQGSLLHLDLVELSDERYTLLISLPAVYADVGTLKNLVREISVSYAACLYGEQLFDEPIQYADVSEILNDLLESEETKAGREYWCQLDFADLFTLKLTSENQLPVEPGFSPQFLTWAIADQLAAEIEAIAQKYETTTEVVLLTCLAILLWRLTQQSRIMIGTACDGRNYEGLESAFGLFAKYLPLVCHLEENRTFSEILQQVNEFSRQNAEWQEYFTPEQTAEATSFFPFCFEFEHRQPKYSVDNNLSLSVYQQYAYIVLQPLEDSYLSKLLDLCQGAEAIILSQFSLLGYDIIEKLGVPCYAACIPPISPTQAFPHPAAPIELRLGGIYNRLTYFLFDQLLWRFVRGPINRWRQEVLKLTPTAWWLSPVARLHQQKLPFLYGYSPSLLPKPSEWPDWLHVTGYWFIDCPESWQPPIDLVDFIAIGSPPVYVAGRGLTEEELKLVLSAIAQTGQRCILQVPGELTGENSLSEDFHLSDKVFKLSEWVPFDWLFPQMAALVHHGGAGTLAYGVRSGVPSITIPSGDDRFFWAHRVAELGLSPKPILPHQLSAQRLADAIRLATNDKLMRACAAAMGRKIQAENGVVRAIEAFHHHLSNKV